MTAVLSRRAAVALAITAVKRAAEPKYNPFPPALAGHDKLEFEFNFFYAN